MLSHPTIQRSRTYLYDTYYDSCTTTSTESIDAKLRIMEVSLVLKIQFVLIVFAIYPKLLNIFYFCCLVYSTGISTHPFTLKPFHHGPYQDPQDLYHQDSCAESDRNDCSYRNERPYERRSCCYRTYHRNEPYGRPGSSCRYYDCSC